MIVDANILLYSIDVESPHHETAANWLRNALEGPNRVGFPVQSLGAFARIATHPRVTRSPLTASQAHDFIDAWLAFPAAWVPAAGARTVAIQGELVRRHHITGNLVPDAQLAALAIEHGVGVASFDSDFARFPEVTWISPTH